jgi:tetratricopeptide (TPR) repeat protein
MLGRAAAIGIAVGVAAWIVAPNAATAQDAARDREAREVFDEGTALFNEGHYEEAAHTYERAYELSARPIILLNATTAYERALDMESAASTLERYLDVAESPEDAEELRARLARLLELARGASTPSVIGTPSVTLGAPPTPAPPPAPPLPARPLAIWPTLPPPLVLAPAPALTSTSDRAAPSDGESAREGANGWAVLGAVLGIPAAIVTVIGIVVGGLAVGAAGDLASVCANRICPATAAGDLASAYGLADASTALGAVGLGLGALATGAIAIALVQGSERRPSLVLSPFRLEARF